MTTIVGLDLSLRSAGVAGVSDATNADHIGIAWPYVTRTCGRDGRKGEDYQRRSRRVRKQTRDVLALALDTTTPDLVVIEGPIYAGTMMPSYFDRAGLFHGVYGALDARNIPIAVVSPTTGHQFVTGKGSLPKQPDRLKAHILDHMRRLVPDVTVANPDIADALGLAYMGALSLGLRLPWRPHRWQYEAVYTASWPHGRPVQREVHR